MAQRRALRSLPDPRYFAIRVDANFFDDSIGHDERRAADRLIELAAEEVSMVVPHSVRGELQHPNTPAASRRRASELPFTYDTGLGDQARLQLIQEIMRGNARPDKHLKDAAHLFDAAAWQATYFVTCDHRIHRKALQIVEALGLWIVTPSQMLAIYQQFVDADQ